MNDKTIIGSLGPSRVGKYVLRAKLGEGAMGVVYDGHDPDIDRPVAIKTIHRHLIEAAGAEDWLERFNREARAAGRVLHPNLVTIFDFLIENGQPYLVMERLDASATLEDRMAEANGLQLAEVATIFGQMCDGLTAIHAAGIIHRDMKPANVMLADGRLKLTDFGIARITTMDKTSAGMIGTPSYMAPEQFSGAEVDARSDIYATGVVLYEVLTGQLPFARGGIDAMIMATKGEAPKAPSAIVSGLPPTLDELVLTAIAADPALRFPDAPAMKAALMAALSDTPGSIKTLAPRADAPRSTETMIGRLSGAAMEGLENSLVSRIGPMGRILARRAAKTAVSQDDLLQQILSEVAEGPEREDLRRAMAKHLSGNTGPATPGGAISDADLARIIAELTPHLGPIAGTMVRRQASTAGSTQDLLNKLAESIPDANGKATFLSGMAGKRS